MRTVVVAEKPSVARDVAAILGARSRGDGYLYGDRWVVTWALGHLAALPEPQQIDPAWKAWQRETLPMLPRRWPLVVLERTRRQFEIVARWLCDPEIDRVVCATDAGREGELIFRLIYEAAGSKKPVERLWISSLTPEAIRAGFASLKDAARFDPLAAAARGRAQADWLVGMNLSRAYTLVHGGAELYSIGRVQTPTLAMLVDREDQIRAFVPEDYLEVVARFGPEPAYRGTWFELRAGTTPSAEAIRAAKRLPADGARAQEIADRVRAAGHGEIESVEEEIKRLAPPLLYDLTELQRHAHRLFGFTAQRTLEIAQRLYEHHKVISYPRTDSRHLSAEIAATLPEVTAAIVGRYPGKIAPGTGGKPLSRRYVDDTKVGDHHAILPTPKVPRGLPADEEKIYDLIARRLLAAWHRDHLFCVTTVITKVGPDRFHTSGTTVKEPGWKVLDLIPARAKGAGEDRADELPTGLTAGARRTVDGVEIEAKQTRPPKRFTEATLLTAMETAGRTLEDEELSRAMRDSGLGTPATRAAIIETLIDRGFVERDGKVLRATARGSALIASAHPEVKSPLLTGRWEARLARIERGEEALPPFLEEIEGWVRSVVHQVLSTPPAPVPPAAAPARPRELTRLLRETFQHPHFRPHQEAVCRALVEGKNALLVMPTGAGKSLCYQLPGLARGGPTLVLSPLIALMEDQVQKLEALGVRAARIHSGRPREASRAVCRDYLAGGVEILYIAPERLAVPGFVELLARRRPALIAIDEAHCISDWGHDFRPDYRLLADRLPHLGAAPILALTATATPRVQDDIAEQLRLGDGLRFIHGFRRDNLAIEAAEVLKADRPALVASILASRGARPAIVYALSRKDADALAAQLGRRYRAAAYHAGKKSEERDRVQAAFLSGEIEVVVATIAFGMGVDKPDVRTIVHLGLTRSVEGYYQEIGRAGRDGRPARAILLHSYGDRRVHEYFLEREYPPPAMLERVQATLGDQLEPWAAVAVRSGLSPEDAERALTKLVIHGGAISSSGLVRRGDDRWPLSYRAQREHRARQQEEMAYFASTWECRMLRLVRHFGEASDEPCARCDRCAPQARVVRSEARGQLPDPPPPRRKKSRRRRDRPHLSG